MTALIVISAIALFILILLASSIRVDVEFDRVFKYRVKYLFFTFIKDSPPKKQKKKKKEKKKEDIKKKENIKDRENISEKEKAVQIEQHSNEKKQSQDKTKKEPASEKPKMKFSLDLIKRIIGRASPHVKRIFKKIRLSNVVIDITAGGDDAAKTAISYGVHCSAVYGLITFLDSVISFKADSISVRADFDLPKNEYYAKGTLKLRLSTLLHSGIWGFFAVLAELRKASGAPPEKNTLTQNKAA